MKGSLFLGRIAGIGIYIHWTFAILIGWILVSFYMQNHEINEALVGVLFIALLFTCVVLHELGHALTAKRYKIITKSITLLPIGGLANLEKLPEVPSQELKVAIAGPIVNLFIAAGLFAYLYWWGHFPGMEEIKGMKQINMQNLVFNLFAANVLLAVFNLIPAFPMDGGRVLRAFLAMRMDRVAATQAAASVGRFLAIAFVFFGIFYDIWLVFIGIFVYLGASAESLHETARSTLKGFVVRDVMMKKFEKLYASQTLQTAVDILLSGQDTEFPILGLDGVTVEGILTRTLIVKGLQQYGAEVNIGQIMDRKVTTLDPDMPLQDAFEKILAVGSKVCPVYEEGVLLGIVDQQNIQEFLMIRSSLNTSDARKKVAVS